MFHSHPVQQQQIAADENTAAGSIKSIRNHPIRPDTAGVLTEFFLISRSFYSGVAGSGQECSRIPVRSFNPPTGSLHAIHVISVPAPLPAAPSLIVFV
jgi:hypothetical protein